MTGIIDDKFGVAFSGGGIRSAAFCSGVLRRLIQQEAEPDYLSCVSGGGYTGSAYVEWKCRNRQDHGQNYGENRGQYPVQEQAEWAKDFFNQMRKQTGYYCNWQSCWGCCDSIILGALLVFVGLIVPIIGWGSFAFPIAFMVNLLYGQFLDGTQCRRDDDSNDCIERTVLFSVSISLFIIFHFIEYCCGCCENKDNHLNMKSAKVSLKICQMISGATFAFTFFPWFINDFLQYTHIVIRIAIVAFTAVFWFFVPVLRKYSSLVILIYAYSYVVFWRVYKGELFSYQYTENRFRNGMTFSLVALGVFSVLGDVPLRLVHIYSRWRLQKAFYYHGNKKNKGCCSSCHEKCSCFWCSYEEQCCYCYDIFPGGHCSSCCCTSCICPPTQIVVGQNLPSRALTLEDLNDIKPQYISNMVVNGWHKKYNQKYCLLSMSPQGISVIDQQPQKPPPPPKPKLPPPPSSSSPTPLPPPKQPPPPSSSSPTPLPPPKQPPPPSSSPTPLPPPKQPPPPSSSLPTPLPPPKQPPPPSSSSSSSPAPLPPPKQPPPPPSSSSSSSPTPLPPPKQPPPPSSSSSSPTPLQPPKQPPPRKRPSPLDNFRKDCLNGHNFKDKLKPSDIKLSSAMAMSAAAVSPYFGKYEETEQTATHILTICGLEMAASLVSDMADERSEGHCKSLLYIVNMFIAGVFVAGGILYYFWFPENYFPSASILVTGLVVGGIFLLLLLWLCIASCCSCSECCTRWCIVHVLIYRFIRSLLNIITDGETPPAMMHLSDGGHFENFGLLPLLKLRLPKILVVDGSHIGSDEEYAKEIVTVMEQAREILDCSFTATDGGDVLTHIKNNYVKPVDERLKRIYKFKVRYSATNDVDKRALTATEGEIVLIAPRSPSGVHNNKTDEYQPHEMNTDPNGIWKFERDVSEDDAGRISGCPAGLGCCECSGHKYGCECSCLASCLSFPRHATANQFFTPEMFTVYHREGYRTCMEKDVDDFLMQAPASDPTGNEGQRPSTSRINSN